MSDLGPAWHGTACQCPIHSSPVLASPSTFTLYDHRDFLTWPEAVKYAAQVFTTLGGHMHGKPMVRRYGTVWRVSWRPWIVTWNGKSA